uniref:Uncharacterized protein n=1 Tax=viral metagenome TaxID=1070528 RepID=A0A6C0LQC3_9ZZZZ
MNNHINYDSDPYGIRARAFNDVNSVLSRNNIRYIERNAQFIPCSRSVVINITETLQPHFVTMPIVRSSNCVIINGVPYYY